MTTLYVFRAQSTTSVAQSKMYLMAEFISCEDISEKIMNLKESMVCYVRIAIVRTCLSNYQDLSSSTQHQSIPRFISTSSNPFATHQAHDVVGAIDTVSVIRLLVDVAIPSPELQLLDVVPGVLRGHHHRQVMDVDQLCHCHRLRASAFLDGSVVRLFDAVDEVLLLQSEGR